MAAPYETMLSSMVADFTESSDNAEHYESFLAIIREHKLLALQKSGSIDVVAGHINELLNSGKSRCQGLCLLNYMLEQCSSEVFVEHARTWLRLLIQALQSQEHKQSMQLTCSAVARLVQHVTSFPEMSRDVSNNILPQLMNVLFDAGQEWQKVAVHCMCNCIQAFPGPCGPFRNKIEKMVLPLLDGLHNDCVQEASACFAMIPRCGGGGNLGVKHTEAWTMLSDRLLGTLHLVLDSLYQDVETELIKGGFAFDVSSFQLYLGLGAPTMPRKVVDLGHLIVIGLQSYTIPKAQLDLSSPPVEEPKHTFVLQHRFSALVITLTKLLEQEFPAVVKLPISDILDVVCRTLGVTDKVLIHRVTREKVHLRSVLPFLHSRALYLLSSLILSCGRNMLPYTATVNKLFVQTLTWTAVADTVYGQEKPNSGLRQEVYGTMCAWLQTIGAGSAMEMYADQIIVQAMIDATPPVDVLKIETKSTKAADLSDIQYGKKKKKKGGSREVGSLSTHRKVNLLANSSLCASALKVIRQLVLAVGTSIKPKCHKDIQTFLIPLLLKIQQSPLRPPLPYSSATCRKELYHLLLVCVLVPHPRWPPPTQCAVKIFSQGQRDLDLEVSGYVTEALTMCETIIHPRAPPLQEPLPLADLNIQTCVVTNHSASSKDVEMIPSVSAYNEQFQDTTQNDNDGMLNTQPNIECQSFYISRTNKQVSSSKIQAAAGPSSTKSSSGEDEGAEIESEEDRHTVVGASTEESDLGKYINVSGQPAKETAETSDKSLPESLVVTLDTDCQSGQKTDIPSQKSDNSSMKLDADQENRYSGNLQAPPTGEKRKLPVDAEDEPDVKKSADEVDLMLSSFVDAGPDSD